MIIIAATFFAAWTPYGVVSLWATFGDPSQIPVPLITSCSMCGKASAAINPMVYTATNKTFRKSVQRVGLKMTSVILLEVTLNGNDMLFYLLTAMMCFLTKEW